MPFYKDSTAALLETGTCVNGELRSGSDCESRSGAISFECHDSIVLEELSFLADEELAKEERERSEMPGREIAAITAGTSPSHHSFVTSELLESDCESSSRAISFEYHDIIMLEELSELADEEVAREYFEARSTMLGSLDIATRTNDNTSASSLVTSEVFSSISILSLQGMTFATTVIHEGSTLSGIVRNENSARRLHRTRM